MINAVTRVPAASAEIAMAHFESLLSFETDCWDTHEAMRDTEPGFVLLDVRSPERYALGHVPRALNLPHAKIIGSRTQTYASTTVFVAYCAGPHCNGAVRAAAKLAHLGFAVKIMSGGITGWIDEGFALETGGGQEG
jgi:rhodanese-related sulfurtransferase